MAAGGVVFLDGTGQAKGSLLNQIKQIQALALITLCQIDNQAKVGRNHLILGPFATANHTFFFIAVLTGRTTPASQMTAFCDGDHRLNLSPHHEFLLWSEQLMATNFAEKSTQRTRHHDDTAELNLEPKCFFLAVIIKTPELILCALFHSFFLLVN